MEKEIHVGLYGGKGLFGGREKPLEASVITCGMYGECSFYKEGNCLNVRSMGGGSCKYGSTRTVKGYTSRAKKYMNFKNKWGTHEEYGKLKYPNKKLGLIGDTVAFNYPYLSITEGGKELTTRIFSNSTSYIKYEDLTVDVIRDILEYRPQAMMGGEITEYQKEIVPLIIFHLSEILEEKYLELVDEYPVEYGEIDYVGRKAYLHTINPSEVSYVTHRGNVESVWDWDGEYLEYKEGNIGRFDIARNVEEVDVRLKPDKSISITITNNKQVSDKTKFLD